MAEQHNILFLFADQLHAFALGCMGHPQVKTPHLDKLAAQGVLFHNMYSCAPVCTPYRGTLFTGMYASQSGVERNVSALPAGVPTLADRLNEAGYRTSYVGKWHLGGKGNIAVPRELRGGFQDFIGYQCYNEYVQDV
ncbi:MAG: arylsulfatase, partial [Paenibacillaceae bacterium]|nr:arylsulfatase [Paenibacillaceae bacterium]